MVYCQPREKSRPKKSPPSLPLCGFLDLLDMNLNDAMVQKMFQCVHMRHGLFCAGAGVLPLCTLARATCFVTKANARHVRVGHCRPNVACEDDTRVLRVICVLFTLCWPLIRFVRLFVDAPFLVSPVPANTASFSCPLSRLRRFADEDNTGDILADEFQNAWSYLKDDLAEQMLVKMGLDQKTILRRIASILTFFALLIPFFFLLMAIWNNSSSFISVIYSLFLSGAGVAQVARHRREVTSDGKVKGFESSMDGMLNSVSAKGKANIDAGVSSTMSSKLKLP